MFGRVQFLAAWMVKRNKLFSALIEINANLRMIFDQTMLANVHAMLEAKQCGHFFLRALAKAHDCCLQ